MFGHRTARPSTGEGTHIARQGRLLQALLGSHAVVPLQLRVQQQFADGGAVAPAQIIRGGLGRAGECWGRAGRHRRGGGRRADSRLV